MLIKHLKTKVYGQQDYVNIKEPLMDFFHKRGVTQATIQPEFFSVSTKNQFK